MANAYVKEFFSRDPSDWITPEVKKRNELADFAAQEPAVLAKAPRLSEDDAVFFREHEIFAGVPNPKLAVIALTQPRFAMPPEYAIAAINACMPQSKRFKDFGILNTSNPQRGAVLETVLSVPQAANGLSWSTTDVSKLSPNEVAMMPQMTKLDRDAFKLKDSIKDLDSQQIAIMALTQLHEVIPTRAAILAIESIPERAGFSEDDLKKFQYDGKGLAPNEIYSKEELLNAAMKAPKPESKESLISDIAHRFSSMLGLDKNKPAAGKKPGI